MTLAPNFTEDDEAEAVARIDELLRRRGEQHRYIAQAQREVDARRGNLLILDVHLERAKAWLENIHGHDRRRTMTHKEFMDLIDEIERRRESTEWVEGGTDA